MKQRSIAWSLLFAILLTAIPAVFSVTAETEDMLTNVALGAKYESSAPYVLDADKHTNNYRNKDYDELTDGEKGSDPVGDEWYAFMGDQGYYITVDLGEVKKDLVRIAVEFCNKNDWGIALPAEVKASGSIDGIDYVDLGSLADADADSPSEYHEFVLDISGEYRYIRIDIMRAGVFTFVSEVEVYAPVSDEEPIAAEYCLPVDGEIVRAYSDTVLVYFPSMGDYRVHLGVDIAVPLGTEVLCYTGGVVIAVYQDTMMGTTVEVSHQDGLVSYYKNLDVTLADGIEAGQSVSAGQVIGTVGNTAVLEKVEEPHLHFELYQNDKSIDPEPYLLAAKNGEPVGHIHGQTKLISVASTCLEHGYFATVCTECGEEIARKELPLLSHPYLENGVCDICGYTSEYRIPLDGDIIREYYTDEQRYDPTMQDYRAHAGLDIASPIGAEVYSYAGGVVTEAFLDTLYGMTVEVTHPDGLISRYRGLQDTLADGIVIGSEVLAGQLLGYVGGNISIENALEPHLHFELYQNDESIDPEPYLLAMKENGGTNIPACLYGDVNDDGVVNGNDVTRLLRHLASYDAEMDSSTVEVFDGADCNGDGMIDGRDAVRLIRYLAYLDPATGESSVVLGPETQEPETPAPEVFVPELGDGTEETPYLVIPNTKTLSMTTVAIDAGQSVVYGIQRIGGKSVTINDPDAYIVYEGVRYEAVDGVLSVQLEPVLASEDILLEIGNDGAEEQSFVLQFSDPVGSYENPTTVDLSEKSYNISLAADDSDGFYYRYTATNNGTIRFLMTASTNGLLSVTNNSDFVQRTSDFDGQTDENGWTYIEIDVQTGEELLIVVGALPNRRGKYPAIDIVWMAQYID